MFFLNIFKISDFSKIYIFNFNLLFYLFNKFLILLNNLVFYNCYYIYSMVNIIWFLKKNNFSIFKFYISRKFNLCYQKKNLNLLFNYYKF